MDKANNPTLDNNVLDQESESGTNGTKSSAMLAVILDNISDHRLPNELIVHMDIKTPGITAKAEMDTFTKMSPLR